jgi:branched-chain amino acid transport system substrate-binding protein
MKPTANPQTITSTNQLFCFFAPNMLELPYTQVREIHMKYIKLPIIIIITILTLASCLRPTDNTNSSQSNELKKIKLATYGDVDYFNGGESFLRGVEMAVDDANSQYADMGYTVEHTFYNDGNEYEQGMFIIDELEKDPELTAVFASQNIALSEPAARRFENVGKILVAPFGMPENVLTQRQYNNVFSATYAPYDIGMLAGIYAISSGIKRWAVCYYDDDFNREEVRGFEAAGKESGFEILDYQKTIFPESDFEYIYSRWKSLGIEGVFIAPNDLEGYNLLKLIREKDEAITLIGDFAFDFAEKSYEYAKYLDGFVLIANFYYNNNEVWDFYDRYKAEYNKELDSWALQGYNLAKMIIDTAVTENTTVPSSIAAAIHHAGYKGIAMNISFKENGELVVINEENFSVYSVYNDGYFEDVTIGISNHE